MMMSDEKKITDTIGLAPGTMVHVGEEQTESVTINLIEYDETNFSVKEIKSIEECFPICETDRTKWIHVTGLHQIDVIEKIGGQLKLHPLVLEDIVNTEQRPKIEVYDDYIFITLKMLTYDEVDDEIDLEQLSIILGKNYVVSFEEKPANALDILMKRIEKPSRRLRLAHADYLAYSMIDVVVDTYFTLLEKISERIDELEDAVIKDPSSSTLQDIYELKRELLFLHKSVWPLREIINGIVRMDTPLIEQSTNFYLEDVNDHIRQIMDTVDIYRDMVTSMLETYLSAVNIKLNDVMKVLTIFASIFIPLTFISSVYGMNFKHMPELDWDAGYYLAWGVMLAIAITMLRYFRRKKWL